MPEGADECSREHTDAEQIRNLFSLYAFAYDQGEANKFAALFAEDGEFEIVDGPTVRGREALASMVTAAAARPGRTLHMVSNVRVTVMGDDAKGQAYVMLLLISEGSLRVVAMGTYDDTLVRAPSGWMLSRRRFKPDVGPDANGIPITWGAATDVSS